MLGKWIDRFERGFLAGLFLFLLGLAFVQILLRNFFDSGLVWADEAIKVLVLWLAMSGALYATRGAKHINIDVITRFLPIKIANAIYRLIYLITGLICAACAYYTAQFVLLEYEDPIDAFLGIPTWVCELIIPVVFLLMAMRFAVLVWKVPLLYVVQKANHAHAEEGKP